MFRCFSLFCFVLSYQHVHLKPVDKENKEYPSGSYTDENSTSNDLILSDAMIDRLLEDNRLVDTEDALESKKLKVGEGSVEFSPGNSSIKIERKNHKTQISIQVDESKINTNSDLVTYIDGIQQEASMSSGEQKTIAKFYIDQLGDDANNRKINIEQIDGGLIHHKNATDARTGKGISIQYFKGIAYHLPDGSTARRHSLRIKVKPALLDKELTRINVTIGEREPGKTYINVAGVHFLMRDDSAEQAECLKNPRCTRTTTRFVSRKLQKPSRTWNVRIPKDKN